MLMRLVESVDVQVAQSRCSRGGHLILCFDSGIERKEGRAETDSYPREHAE